MTLISDNQAPERTKDPVFRLAGMGVALLLISLFASRAPTTFNGKLPFIGQFIPLDLNVVYLIVLGPIAATLLAAYFWHLTTGRSPESGNRSPYDLRSLGFLFGLFGALTLLLSVQYFLILAPEPLCPTRSHFDFLWTNPPGPTRIFHCMGGTEELNKNSPYYLEPMIVQSWGHIFWPILTSYFLYRAWQRWRPSSERR
ncbi:hypothetical protein BJF93_14300 [Xaviernesmea oryzae]|uniref:Uncharacterized protein n=1 Tax=Xaviernesmea oryzae TaxID=464029 RepID=A0A1Q9AXG4_9HYPH|nr:hypothetical protein [Xaviernesmea oryzae]OLP60152.1 hypothetical protein BJF93_14300 [Xaviernesmea oryzae]SEM37494.1 hypothetical protein SAMN04487976_1351 [Xaviernesmea oryzae]